MENLKRFFNELKAATTGPDAPVTRLFITGVTPVTMDDVTSGFNIGSNISMNPAFAALTGFTRDDLREQGGMVTLHRLVVVFHGGDVALCEEIRGE